MSLKRRALDLDGGKLIVAPLFGLLMVVNMFAVSGDVRALAPVTAMKLAALAHRLLVVGFYALLVYLYLVRSSARATVRSLAAKVTAIAATFLPAAIPILGRQTENQSLLLLADVTTIFGMAVALYSLNALGRSFSIIPQARNLVQEGPYRFVRHPLYVGELTAVLGIVLARPTLPAAAVFCVLAALQACRAVQEERLLAGEFPEYERYSLKVSRFIPGVL